MGNVRKEETMSDVEEKMRRIPLAREKHNSDVGEDCADGKIHDLLFFAERFIYHYFTV